MEAHTLILFFTTQPIISYIFITNCLRMLRSSIHYSSAAQDQPRDICSSTATLHCKSPGWPVQLGIKAPNSF